MDSNLDRNSKRSNFLSIEASYGQFFGPKSKTVQISVHGGYE